MPKLNVKSVAAITKPGLHADGGNLYLRVSATGAKSWIVRLVVHTDEGRKRRDLGIGSAAMLSLAEARAKAAEMVRVARIEGADPDAPRRADREARAEAARRAVVEAERARMTFAECARQRHAQLLPGWKNKKHGETWLASLALHVFPVFGEKPVHEVSRDDVERALAPIWTQTPETARRIRQRIADIFDWAKGKGLFEGENPVAGVKNVLPVVRASKEHHPAMSWRDLPAFMLRLDEREGISARCLQFLILTAVRSGEARGARWGEIDLEGGFWTIPAERMKRPVEHRVPLSAEALAVLDRVKGHDGDFVFPSAQAATDGSARPMSDMVFKALFTRMAASGFVTHGFRSTFRDWCSDCARAEPELCEAALAHTTGNSVTRAYARSDLFNRRRALMEQWGRYCTGQAGRILQMVRA